MVKTHLTLVGPVKGLSLIEVLVSVVVLAIGMLGIASLLIAAEKANNSSYSKQQAAQAAYNIFDKIRANSQAGIDGNYDANNIGGDGMPVTVTVPSTLCNTTSNCTAAQLATYDLFLWFNRDLAMLPNGSGSITTALNAAAGNTIVTITVQWNDSAAQTLLGSSSNESPTATSVANANFVQLTIQSQL